MKKFFLGLFAVMVSFTAMADDNNLWGGYYDGADDRSGLGTSQKTTYNQASYFDGSLTGQTIDSVAVYFRSNSNLKDVKLWVSTTLPASADEADGYVAEISRGDLIVGDESDTKLGELNVIGLTTPYTITESGAYVGVSYTITSTSNSSGKYPIVMCAEKVAGSLWLKAGGKTAEWYDYGLEYGALAMQLLFVGEKPANAATPGDFAPMIAGLNDTADAKVTLHNVGTEGIQDIDYVVTVDGVTEDEQHLVLDTPCNLYAGCTVVTIPMKAGVEQGASTKVFTITKVNGLPNESADPSSEGLMNTIQEVFTHRVAVEEYTGTGCGYCPRGLQGMENLREAFGDQFVGIALHQYNSSDPMYISNYYRVSFQGAPSCQIERRCEVDPYWGGGGYTPKNDICDDVREYLATIAECGVEVAGEWTSADCTSVKATATVTAIASGYDYDIEYVLVADSVVGSTSSWAQSNYYCDYSKPSQGYVRDDMAKFCKGGDYGKSKFTDYPFNDVALASSHNGKSNAANPLGGLEAYTPVENSFTISMPTKASLLSALNYNKIYIVALVINTETGYIVNAAKSLVVAGESSTIEQINTENAAAGHTYDLMGREVSASQQGLTIRGGKVILNR